MSLSLVFSQSLGNVLSVFTRIDPYDLVFVLSAIAFNLLIVGIFISQRHQRPKLTRTLGIVWLSLAIPFVIVFVHYVTVGRDPWILVYYGFILLYFIVELLLDYVLKIEFRQKLITHIPYIILEYIALFGLIGISFAIDRTWGILVSITFWAVMASLIYLYWGRKKKNEAP